MRQSVVLLPLLLQFATSQPANTTNGISSTPISCELSDSEARTCESCISKGAECFWCGENNRCLHYEWYFPGCAVTEVKYTSCWINWSAVAVVCAVLAGIVLVILFVIVCCCCCRISAARKRRAQKLGEKREKKNELRMENLANQQAERRVQREKEMDVYREKYGITKNSSARNSISSITKSSKW